MKRFILTPAVLAILATVAIAGGYSGKELKQVAPPPCPEWYADNEWNVSLWGTYAFTNTDYAPNESLVDLIVSTTEGHTVFGTFDRYIGGDHAWGGGGDIKYFFHRYFGVGIEGFILNAHRNAFDIDLRPEDEVFLHEKFTDRRAVGAVLGTFTLRYPVPCTRFAPYAWAGIGAIFGGGQHEKLITEELDEIEPMQAEDGEDEVPFVNARTRHFGSETKLLGQFGAGLEVRITPHIGWINDLSWGVIEGPKNNFGMFRSGVNFAF